MSYVTEPPGKLDAAAVTVQERGFECVFSKNATQNRCVISLSGTAKSTGVHHEF